MKSTNRLLCKMITLGLILSTSVGVQAAASNTVPSKEPKPKAPIVVEADELSFNDLSGALLARGNVNITQGADKLSSELVRGNTKQRELWIDGSATLLQPNTKLTGVETWYNYQDRIGSMKKASGIVDKQRVTGNNIDIHPNEVIIHDATLTTCPAIIPDYHVSATKVEIWPGEKLIAYNAKFWIKNKVIFTMDKYQKSLDKNAPSEFPRIGYNNDDGFYISQYLERPVTNNLAVYTDLGYYSKRGFTPTFGLVDREKNFTTNVTYGEFRDSDGYWIKKEPELRLDYKTHRIGTSHITYSGYALYGKWIDGNRSSWHQDYYLYFNRDPVHLSKTLTLDLGAGFQQVRESYNDSVMNSFKFDTTLGKTWSPKLYTWAAYHYTRNNAALFAYNNTDLARQLNLGFRYKIDRMNTIAFVQTYDLNQNRIYDQDYTWYRNLHCWQAAITYRAKREQIKFDISVAKW